MLTWGLEWHSLDSYFSFKELSATPVTPETNHIRLYAKDNGSGVSTLCYVNDAGIEVCLPATGIIPTGSDGAAGAVAFWTSATNIGADVAHFFWDNTNDQLLIGIQSGSHFGTDTGIVVDEDGASSIIGTAAHSATVAHAGALNLLRSRGTHASQTIVASGDKIGRIVGEGYDGAAYRDAAAIDIEVDGTPGASDMPGRLVFLTTPDGSVTLAQRGSIDNAGKMYLASSAKTHTGTNFKLSIDSDTEVTGFEINAHHTAGPALFFHQSRGTHATSTVSVDGDRVAFILGKGFGGTSYHDLASIQFAVDGTPGNNDMPGRISLFTTPDGSATLSERFRIGAAGQWGIGGATFGTAGNLFQSGGASAAPSWLDHTTDFLSQYALLAGRSGGQILIGGTAVADDLTLRATSGVGAGSEQIIFQLGSNGAIGAGKFVQTNSHGALIINLSTVAQATSSFEAKLGTDLIFATGNGTLPDGSTASCSFQAFNDAATANVPLEFRADGVYITNTGNNGLVVGSMAGTSNKGDGTINAATGYYINGTAGVSFGPAAVTSITVVNGIVTAIS